MKKIALLSVLFIAYTGAIFIFVPLTFIALMTKWNNWINKELKISL